MATSFKDPKNDGSKEGTTIQDTNLIEANKATKVVAAIKEAAAIKDVVDVGTRAEMDAVLTEHAIAPSIAGRMEPALIQVQTAKLHAMDIRVRQHLTTR